jgi:hypothetical protein
MLSARVRRPLEAIWLANDQFSDLIPLRQLFYRVFVPESQSVKAYPEKRQVLDQRADLQTWIQMPPQPQGLLTSVRCFAQIGSSFDVVNFDYCAGFCPYVERTIGALLRNRVLRNGGYLFLTVTERTRRSNYGALDERVLAHDEGRVIEQVSAEARLAGWTIEPLAGYPWAYQGGPKRTAMLSFGWQLSIR